MNIRQATIDDFSMVKCITCETIKAIYPHYYPEGAVEFFLDHHSDKNILDDIESNRTFMLEKGNTMVGTTTIKGNEICRLFVLPEHQGKGYGKALLNFSEQIIFRQNTTVRLDASLPAKEIYMKCGYRYRSSHSLRTGRDDFLCYDVLEKADGTSVVKINLNGKRFVPKVNSANGEVSEQTVFNYFQQENVIWADYTGGGILRGYLIGTMADNGELDFYYQHINSSGQLRIGKCHSIPNMLDNGKLELEEQWQWLDGNNSTGSSTIIEL